VCESWRIRQDDMSPSGNTFLGKGNGIRRFDFEFLIFNSVIHLSKVGLLSFSPCRSRWLNHVPPCLASPFFFSALKPWELYCKTSFFPALLERVRSSTTASFVTFAGVRSCFPGVVFFLLVSLVWFSYACNSAGDYWLLSIGLNWLSRALSLTTICTRLWMHHW